MRAALDALAAAHVEINQAAAQALLGSEESLGAVETLESIAAHNLTVASHMVILTGVLSKVAGLVASGKKVVEAAKGLADAKV